MFMKQILELWKIIGKYVMLALILIFIGANIFLTILDGQLDTHETTTLIITTAIVIVMIIILPPLWNEEEHEEESKECDEEYIEDLYNLMYNIKEESKKIGNIISDIAERESKLSSEINSLKSSISTNETLLEESVNDEEKDYYLKKIKKQEESLQTLTEEYDNTIQEMIKYIKMKESIDKELSKISSRYNQIESLEIINTVKEKSKEVHAIVDVLEVKQNLGISEADMIAKKYS